MTIPPTAPSPTPASRGSSTCGGGCARNVLPPRQATRQRPSTTPTRASRSRRRRRNSGTSPSRRVGCWRWPNRPSRSSASCRRWCRSGAPRARTPISTWSMCGPSWRRRQSEVEQARERFGEGAARSKCCSGDILRPRSRWRPTTRHYRRSPAPACPPPCSNAGRILWPRSVRSWWRSATKKRRSWRCCPRSRFRSLAGGWATRCCPCCSSTPGSPRPA